MTTTGGAGSLDRVPLRHLQRDGDDGEPEAVDESVITDPQHWAVRLEEFTEYVDADGNVVDEQRHRLGHRR